MKDTENDKAMLGYKHKKYNRLKFIEGDLNISAHTITTATKIPKITTLTNYAKTIFFVKPHYPFQLATNTHELESLSSEFYRFLLGSNRAPKIRVLLDEANNAYGTISREINGYKAVREIFSEKNQPITSNKMVNAGFGSLMAASYILNEQDLHAGNYGFNNQGNLSRIDFDHNLSAFVSYAVGQGSDEGARPIVPGRP